MLSEAAPADEGYFPHGKSVLRRVHEERIVGLHYGQRALLIGALNPVAFTGTFDHTAGKLRPFKRLAHTGKMFEAVFFGSRAEADEALAFVDRLHQPVRGTLPAAAGPYAAGTPYTAFDPELMLWTMSVIADSGLYFYELFVRQLSDEERESLWQDYIRFGELFGMPREAAPPTYPEFRRWWAETLNSDRMHLTAEGRETGYMTCFEIPFSRWAPAGEGRSRPGHARKPESAREGRLRPLLQPATGRCVARSGHRHARRDQGRPDSVRRGSYVTEFDQVALTEARRIERGEWTPQAAPNVPHTPSELGSPGRSRRSEPQETGRLLVHVVGWEALHSPARIAPCRLLASVLA